MKPADPLTVTKNENGVYAGYRTEVIAQRGRSNASVNIVQCDDQLYRFSIHLHYSYGGFGGPITDHGDGFPTYQQAKEAANAKLLERMPTPWPSEPDSVHAELADLRQQIQHQLLQPTLF